jgi:hypothetical protein
VEILLLGKYLRVKEKELFLRRESVVFDFVKNSNFKLLKYVEYVNHISSTCLSVLTPL